MPIFDLKKERDINDAINHILKLEGKRIEIKEKRNTRTVAQNDARWLYLTKIAEILNERGETFNPPGMNIDVPFTKDNLYQIYWQNLRLHMYPKKKMQLNTKEFTDLVEMAQMMFAKIFSINIPFPSIQQIIEDEL